MHSDEEVVRQPVGEVVGLRRRAVRPESCVIDTPMEHIETMANKIIATAGGVLHANGETKPGLFPTNCQTLSHHCRLSSRHARASSPRCNKQ